MVVGVDPDDVWRTVDEQRAALADLFDDLSPGEWATPSLCAGWTVRDVAAHLTLAHMGLPAAARALVRAGGSFDGMIRATAVRQARLPTDAYGRALRAMVGSRRTAPFLTEVEPMLDVLVHGQDVCRPLGRAHPVPAGPAAVAADRVWSRTFPFRARRRLAGLELVATDAPWRAGSGQRVEGPMAELLLLLTGRTGAVRDLTGPGAGRVSGTGTGQVRGPGR